MTINLNTIKKSMQPAIIASFWTMLRECESKAEDDSDPVLKHQVEQWYSLWNEMTGSEQSPSWINAKKPEDQKVRERLRATVIFQLGLDGSGVIFNDNTTMFELGADSLDRVELVMAIEDEFGLELDVNDEIMHAACVNDAVPIILRKLK